MLEEINWKRYCFFALAVVLIASVFNRKIGAGFLMGSVVYFANLFISSKKFPVFDGKSKVLRRALFVLFIQGIIIALMAYGAFLLGGLECFIASFVAMIIPNLYFFVVGSRI